MSLDLKLVAALALGGEMRPVSDSGITAEYLYDDGQKALQLCFDHFRDHGKVPEVATIEQMLKITLPTVSEPLSFYIAQVKQRRLDNLVSTGVREMAAKVQGDLTSEAVDEAKKLIRSVQSESLVGERIYQLHETVPERIATYDRMKSFANHVDGVPTPWPILTDYTQGYHPGELWVLVGRLGIGKTWLMMKMAMEAWLAEAKVLIISMEMPRPKIERRCDAIYAKVSYPDLKRGMLGHPREGEYKAALASYAGKTPIWTMSRKRIKTTVDVTLALEEVKPDVTFIDGAYKLRPTHGTKNMGQAERVAMVFDELQEITEDKGVPLVATSQFNRKVTKKSTTAGTENIGFSDTIGQNADVIMAAFQTGDMRKQNQMIVELLKNREDEVCKFIINFCLDTMDFSEVGPWDDARSGEAQEDKPKGTGAAFE